jgi:Tfp pilus assembly protein PilF
MYLEIAIIYKESNYYLNILKSIQYLNNVIEIDDKNFDAYLLRGDMFFEIDELKLAKEDYDFASKILLEIKSNTNSVTFPREQFVLLKNEHNKRIRLITA